MFCVYLMYIILLYRYLTRMSFIYFLNKLFYQITEKIRLRIENLIYIIDF